MLSVILSPLIIIDREVQTRIYRFLRRSFSKWTNFKTLIKEELNNRLKKCLGLKISIEVFKDEPSAGFNLII